MENPVICGGLKIIPHLSFCKTRIYSNCGKKNTYLRKTSTAKEHPDPYYFKGICQQLKNLIFAWFKRSSEWKSKCHLYNWVVLMAWMWMWSLVCWVVGVVPRQSEDITDHRPQQSTQPINVIVIVINVNVINLIVIVVLLFFKTILPLPFTLQQRRFATEVAKMSRWALNVPRLFCSCVKLSTNSIFVGKLPP